MQSSSNQVSVDECNEITQTVLYLTLKKETLLDSKRATVAAAEPSIAFLCGPSRDIGRIIAAFGADGAGWLRWVADGADMP